MPVAVVFLLRAVVLVLLWGFVVATVVAVRHDIFGTRATPSALPSASPRPAAAAAAAPVAPIPVPVAAVPVPPVPVKAVKAAAKAAASRPPAAPAAPRRALKRNAPAQAAAVAVRLAVVDGPAVGAKIALSSLPVTIGRAEDTSITLADDYVSSHHARLVPRGTQWLLEDTGSTNGTFVDDLRIGEAVVVPVGGRFRIGRNTLEVQA